MTLRTALAASAAIVLSASVANAAEVAALIGDNTIAMIDTTAKQVTKTWPIAGIAGRVAGIDIRPADGLLYALAEDGTLYTVDLAAGAATMKSKLSAMLPAGTTASVDFNPVADRLRVIGSDGSSLRVNVDDGKVTEDGKLKYADSDPNKGTAPRVVAVAYTNSVKGTKATALYDIDAAAGALVRQDPPNDGILNTVGKLSVAGDAVAFDIWSDGDGGNDAWLVAASGLHSLDLANVSLGPAIAIGGLPGTVRDIAVLPAM